MDEIGFNLSNLRSAVRKLGRGARFAANPMAQMRALRGGVRRMTGGGAGGAGVRVADPTERRSQVLQAPGGGIGRRYRGARLAPVGFPPFVFSATSGQLIAQAIQPQSNIAVKKLVITVARNGTSAATQRASLAQVLCGSDNQLPVVPGAGSGVDVALFGAEVNDNDVAWAPVDLGQLLTIQVALTGVALTTTDTITVVVSMLALTAS